MIDGGKAGGVNIVLDNISRFIYFYKGLEN